MFHNPRFKCRVCFRWCIRRTTRRTWLTAWHPDLTKLCLECAIKSPEYWEYMDAIASKTWRPAGKGRKK